MMLEVSRLIWSDAYQVRLRSRALPIYIYRDDRRSCLAACRKDLVHYYCRICRARLVLFSGVNTGRRFFLYSYIVLSDTGKCEFQATCGQFSFLMYLV